MDHPQSGADEPIAAVAALADPLRRAIYRFVAVQDHSVTRDEAAEAVASSRSAAAFHLDRLVDEGLLEAEFRRLSGRVGPGAGRPSKLYRRTSRDITVTLPPRHYDLAAGLLATAVSESSATGAPVGPALDEAARRKGTELATAVRQRCAPRAGRAARVRATAQVLADHGYEPRICESEVVLGNCPFHALVADHTSLVCGMNLALLDGLVSALPAPGFAARLVPTEGLCCVRLHLDPPEGD